MEITKKYKGYTLKVVMTEAKRGYRYDIYLDGKNKGTLCGKGYTPNYMFKILEGLVDILVNAGIYAGKFQDDKRTEITKTYHGHTLKVVKAYCYDGYLDGEKAIFSTSNGITSNGVFALLENLVDDVE